MNVHNFNKPRLVENKIKKLFIPKPKIGGDVIVEKKIETSFLNNIYQSFLNFIKDNYGFFILITLLSILLYVRYLEVNRRKEKMKDIIEKIDNNI